MTYKEVELEVVEIVERHLGEIPNNFGASLRHECNADSLDIAEIIVDLNDLFGVNIPEDIEEDTVSVKMLTESVCRQKNILIGKPAVAKPMIYPKQPQIQQPSSPVALHKAFGKVR